MKETKVVNLTNRQHAVNCFNAVWDLLEKVDRTKQEDEEMIHKAHSSFYHWTKVKDVTATNISVGYWQLARVYAVLQIGERALYYAERCLEISFNNNLEPFYMAYAHEALSRAYAVLGKENESSVQKEKCKEIISKIENEEYKQLVENDIHTIESSI
ncbi:hypothetical protein CIB95_10715 [Lottiidibacillus patelloidae]|uniref:Uncharacterized protein n=1 Tax=Lottiidibacillus patelloidae TaxID=2670334 RepID=A0A263BTH7_9BACI|nr:hypothetical protein [Lottiidibacillus patelloidae]OZM56687.1 hypothetical protein CIB95_10715 [Lottiidibacillus patelloidae]